MRSDIDKGGRTSIKRADIVDGKKIRDATGKIFQKMSAFEP